MDTASALQVTSDGLRVVAMRCTEVANGLNSAAKAPPVAPSWQANSAAVTAAHARGEAVALTLTPRMRATAAILTRAAAGYDNHESEAVDAFSRVHPGPTVV